MPFVGFAVCWTGFNWFVGCFGRAIKQHALYTHVLPTTAKKESKLPILKNCLGLTVWYIYCESNPPPSKLTHTALVRTYVLDWTHFISMYYYIEQGRPVKWWCCYVWRAVGSSGCINNFWSKATEWLLNRYLLCFSVKILDCYTICSFPKEFLKNSDDILSFKQYQNFGQQKQMATNSYLCLFERILFGPIYVVK